MTTEMENTSDREQPVEPSEEGSRPEAENEAQNQLEEPTVEPANDEPANNDAANDDAANDDAANDDASNDDTSNPARAKPAKKKRASQSDPNSKKRKKTGKKWAKNSVIDKNKLTMFDLISYNPPAIDSLSELNEDEAQPGDEDGDLNEDEREQMSEEKPALDRPSEDSKANDEEEEDEESIGPRVKINENGEIVLDEESLVVKRKKPKDQSIKTVYEDDRIISTRTNYSSFKKPGKASEKKLRWTDNETVKFYTALTIIGTDFTLMSDLFFRDTRTRVDLKNKFKQEEKFHKVLIDNALKKSDLTSIQTMEHLNSVENLNFNAVFGPDSDPEDVNNNEADVSPEEAAT